MSDLQLIVGDHPKYGDGDVLVARSEMHALAVGVDHLCGVRQAGMNSDGLRPRGTLAERFHRLVDQFRVERTAPGELTVTNQWTGETRVLSLGRKEVEGRLKRLTHRKNGTPIQRHVLFGRKGREVFYTGRQRPWRRQAARLSALWDEIEARTNRRRQDYERFPWGSDDLRHFLVVRCEPLTVEQADALTEPLYGPVPDDGSEPEELRPRRYWLDWRRLIANTPGVSEADVLDRNTSVDIRDVQPRAVRLTDLQERNA